MGGKNVLKVEDIFEIVRENAMKFLEVILLVAMATRAKTDYTGICRDIINICKNVIGQLREKVFVEYLTVPT